MRATFITLALEDGADSHVIETRVTHTKKSRSAFDGYNRGRQWEATCREVAKLRIVRVVAPLSEAVAAAAASPLTAASLQASQAIVMTTKNSGGGGSRTRVRE